MTSSYPLLATSQWFSRLANVLDRRSAPRLALLFLGAVLARGCRTVTTWIRAANLSDRYQSCYIAVAAAGKRTDRIARRLLIEVVSPVLKGATRLALALDDTPMKRYGPHVQGVGVHHNPTPGRAWKNRFSRRRWHGSALSHSPPTRATLTSSTCKDGRASSVNPTSTMQWSIWTCWRRGWRTTDSRRQNAGRWSASSNRVAAGAVIVFGPTAGYGTMGSSFNYGGVP